MNPTLNSFFSGGGLFDCGLSMGGVAVQQSFELEPDCCDTLALNFKHSVNRCDISKKLVKDGPSADVYAFNLPLHQIQPGSRHSRHHVRRGQAIEIREPERKFILTQLKESC